MEAVKAQSSFVFQNAWQLGIRDLRGLSRSEVNSLMQCTMDWNRMKSSHSIRRPVSFLFWSMWEKNERANKYRRAQVNEHSNKANKANEAISAKSKPITVLNKQWERAREWMSECSNASMSCAFYPQCAEMVTALYGRYGAYAWQIVKPNKRDTSWRSIISKAFLNPSGEWGQTQSRKRAVSH